MPLQDAFISYATEDDHFAAEIASGLRSVGLSVWFAPLSLKVGDKLLDSIEQGLRQSRSGILILSPHYLAKCWTSYEMDILLRQHVEGNKKLLPIWLNVSKQDVESRHMGLGGIVAITDTSQTSLVVSRLHEVLAFGALREFERALDSDVVTPAMLEALGDRLMNYHEASRQALSKDGFEFIFEAVLNGSGSQAEFVDSRKYGTRQNIIDPFRLTTEAGSGIRHDMIRFGKWMEFGRHSWELPVLRDAFLASVRACGRILMLRCLSAEPTGLWYELVEIPKALLLEARNCELGLPESRNLRFKLGYGNVKDAEGRTKFSLRFDGGEQKLEIRELRKDLCKVHATWRFKLSRYPGSGAVRPRLRGFL